MYVDNANLIEGLAELARQVRHRTLKDLEMAEPSRLLWTPPGTANHILWHAGHALWVQDALTVRPLTGRSELPHGWENNFGQHSQPATISDWPDVAEVTSHLEVQLGSILPLLAEHAETIVTRAYETPTDGGWPLLAGMIHGWHDEARHQGEMYLLLKLRRLA